MGVQVLFTIFLVLLNGFFVAAEFAIVKVRASQIDILISKGSSRAKIARHILDHLDAYLSATQLGITLASLGLGWVGEDVVAKAMMKAFHFFHVNLREETAHQIAIPVGFIFITIAHITFGEQAPKMLAIRYSMETTMFIAWPLRIFYFLLRPFIWFLNKLSNVLLRMMGIKSAGEDEVHTEEELRLILTESEEGGAIKPSENELIQNVFDFDDRMVKQIMVPENRVSAIDVEMGREQVIKQITEEGFSRLPVFLGDMDNVIGIVHSKDLLRSVIEQKFRSIKDIMRPAHFVPENMKINDLLRDFQRQHIQFAIVTNEFGATAGIITMEDIIEELVGEIQDEHDEEKPNVERKSESEYIIKAHASINDVNAALPIALSENPNYDTISGFVNSIFGRIPGVNEKRIHGGYEITILQRKKQTVESVHFRVLEPDQVS